ncbi:MAG TPA: hypothetical protein VLB67_08740 [Acidimicrobiia bacterium]|nr:hypothetical protein [Acidimicrobiia bacterium]
MNTRNGSDTDSELPRLRGISWLFFAAAVLFFAAIFNPVIFGYFDAASESDRLSHVEENLTAIRLIFAGMGLTELALGVALWLWGKQVADHTPGTRGGVARAFAVVGLVAGALSMIGRLSAWFEDPQGLASDDPGLFELLVGVPAWIGFSVALIVFGVLMIRGSMPMWLGVAWIVCGVLFWGGLIPFWFFLAAFAFGIRGIVRFRPGKTTAEQVSGVRPV